MLVAALDDSRERCLEMQQALAEAFPDATMEFFDSAQDMIAWLARHLDSVTLVSLNHDLGPSRLRDGMLYDPGTGRDVTDFLVEMERPFPVIVHTPAGAKSRDMFESLEHAGWPCAHVEQKSGVEWIRDAWAPTVAAMLDN